MKNNLFLMVAFLVMIAPAPISGSQNTTIRIKCTAGEYPNEIQWKLYARSPNVAFLIDPDESAALLSGTGGEEKNISVQNGNYTIFGKDTVGDGWNNAVLTVSTTPFTFDLYTVLLSLYTLLLLAVG